MVAVALLQGRRQQLGLDEPAVDEEHLHGPGAPAHQRCGDEAADGDVAAPALHPHQSPGKIPAQGGVDGGFQLPVAGCVEAIRAVLDKLKGDVGMAQRQMLHQPRHGGGLGAVLPHEFQSRRSVVEQIPDGNGGALRGARLLHLTGHAALQMERRAAARTLLPCENVHPADSGDGRQSLAPEAQGADFRQVVRRAQLAGGVAQKRRGQLAGDNAAAVVRHPDEAHAAPLDLHHHGGRARVDGVLHQFLHHTGRPFYDFAGGDQIRHMGF